MGHQLLIFYLLFCYGIMREQASPAHPINLDSLKMRDCV